MEAIEAAADKISSVKTMITMRNIIKAYPLGNDRLVVLKGVSIRIGAGEFVAITGPSGSGKSTLMNIIGLLDAPSAGSYLLEDQEVGGLQENDQAEVRSRRIGFVFQSFHLLPILTSVENVQVPMFEGSLSASARADRYVTSLWALPRERMA